LITNVKTELDYWKNQLKQFNEISDELIKLKAEQDNVREQERVYRTMRYRIDYHATLRPPFKEG
jgi:hypothetical protein